MRCLVTRCLGVLQVQDVEGKLPPKVAVTIKVAMPPRQAVMYQWVMATGTLKLHPEDPLRHKVGGEAMGFAVQSVLVWLCCFHLWGLPVASAQELLVGMNPAVQQLH